MNRKFTLYISTHQAPFQDGQVCLAGGRAVTDPVELAHPALELVIEVIDRLSPGGQDDGLVAFDFEEFAGVDLDGLGGETLNLEDGRISGHPDSLLGQTLAGQEDILEGAQSAADKEGRGDDVNLITPDDGNDPISGFPILKSVAVTISPRRSTKLSRS